MNSSRAEKAQMAISIALIIITVGTLMTWAKLHINAWSAQEAAFNAAREQGEHATAIRLYEEYVDVPWTPMNLQLANKRSHAYSMDAALSYEMAGRPEDAQRQYLSVIGWTERQYEAYCALNDACDAGALAAHLQANRGP